MPVRRAKPLANESCFSSDAVLSENIRESTQILQAAAINQTNHWIVAFSGGKDSSLVATIVVELLKRKEIKDVRVDVVYSDTLMELPPFGDNALSLLQHIEALSQQNNLPVKTHIATAPVEQRYWFLVLGKGYPPPHNHFRWCTDRLKILPTRRAIKDFIDDQSIVLTGVRFGESENRDGRLKATMCSKDDSECGQGVWLNGDKEMGIPGLAPVAHWRTCKVWDFLMWAAGEWNWPYESLFKMYGDSPATRFGCWMCTLVSEDKALKALTRNAEWQHLSNLSTIRTILLQDGRKEENRIRRPNGPLGRTSVAFRKQVLDRLLELERSLGTSLIRDEEVRAIRAYWQFEEQQESPYTAACKTWKWQPCD